MAMINFVGSDQFCIANSSNHNLCTVRRKSYFNAEKRFKCQVSSFDKISRNLYKPSKSLCFPKSSKGFGVTNCSSNGGFSIANVPDVGRCGEIVRVTKETNVRVKINLDGTGISNCDTGIPFLDHMLDQIASHGLLDINVKASGDTHIDDHHTNEDVALAIGSCLLQALGDRKGIYRFGDFSAPLDEALVHVSLDLSGRPYLGYNLCIPTQRVGNYDTQLVEHFFQSLANTSGMTLHIRQLAGKNTHHIIEATFKAFARALRQATENDCRRSGSIPSFGEYWFYYTSDRGGDYCVVHLVCVGMYCHFHDNYNFILVKLTVLFDLVLQSIKMTL